MQGKLLNPVTGEWSWAQSSTDGVQKVSIEGAIAATLAGPLYLPTKSRAASVGAYLVGGNPINVTVAADAADTGSQYLLNPVGSGRIMALKRAHISGGAGALSAALLTSPNFQLQRFTFTGTPSGASQPIVKQDSTMPASVANLRNAKTGITVTGGTTFYNYQLAQVLSPIGMYAPPIAALDLNADSQIILRPGEGIMVRQASLGSLADMRYLQVDWAWEEFV